MGAKAHKGDNDKNPLKSLMGVTWRRTGISCWRGTEGERAQSTSIREKGEREMWKREIVVDEPKRP
jgi:hypothetical protein